MKTAFANYILNSPKRNAFTIGVYAGLGITGVSVFQAVTDARIQAEAAWALHEYLNSSILLTVMDLSVEAELFGCQVRFSEQEIPTIIGRRASTIAEIESLPGPQVGKGRTVTNLDAAEILATRAGGSPVLGGLIGPFSLAGRIFGVSEALEATVMQPGIIQAILQRVTPFLIEYANAFRQRGATGVVMAEPLAGLLSPRSIGQYSSPYIKQIIDAVQADDFVIILHNCGARLVHVPEILKSGGEIYHFGAPMDIVHALQEVDEEVILCGNLDPTAIFHNGTAPEVRAKTEELIEQTSSYPNFVPSSGCDIPPGTPLENIRAFYDAVYGK